MRQLRELPRAPACPGTGAPAVTHTRDDSVEKSTTSAREQQQEPTEAAGNGSSSQDASGSAKNPGEGPKEVSENAPEADTEPTVSTEAAGKEATQPAQHFLFKCLLNVVGEEGNVGVEMHWVEGQNKDLMNQLCTYLKNTLLRSVTKS